MRDIVLVAVFSALVLLCFRFHYVAPLLWAWLGFMNPHRLTYGFAYSLPFAQIAAAVTLTVFVFSKQKQRFPRNSTAILLVSLYLWMCLSSLLTFNDPDIVLDGWIKVTKIQLMLFVTLMMLQGRKQITALVWVTALSIGFFGFKGGIHTLVRGGTTMVMGPPGSFIEGTNHIALAMVMVVPLMYFLYHDTSHKWLRRGLVLTMGLTCLAVLGTASRGALLAVLMMAAVLGMKSQRRLATTAALVVSLAMMLAFMPDQWTEKMGTITSHEDHSAQSRLYTWQMIWNMAMHHPFTGGGFLITENPATWNTYAVTEWAKAYSPHSLYFQALAEHGFLGLGLYLALGISAWRRCNSIVRRAVTPETEWAARLVRMVQASLGGFAVGGAFVNLVNFDLPYYFVAMVILTDLAVRKQLATLPPTSPGQSAYGVAIGAAPSGR